MSEFEEFQEVRVVRLLKPIQGRFLDSSYDPPPQPRVGETGIIVNILDTVITVENVGQDGDCTWICDFAAEELEPVE